MVATNEKKTRIISRRMKMIHNSNFSVHRVLLEHSHTPRDLPWLLLQPQQPWLWPPLSLIQLHWPPGCYPNTQATSSPSPWPGHSGCLCPPPSLPSGVCKSEIKSEVSLTHHSVAWSSPWRSPWQAIDLPLPAAPHHTWNVSSVRVKMLSSFLLHFQHWPQCPDIVGAHQWSEWIVEHGSILMRGQGDPLPTGTSRSVKAFMMQGGLSMSLFYNVLVSWQRL